MRFPMFISLADGAKDEFWVISLQNCLRPGIFLTETGFAGLRPPPVAIRPEPPVAALIGTKSLILLLNILPIYDR